MTDSIFTLPIEEGPRQVVYIDRDYSALKNACEHLLYPHREGMDLIRLFSGSLYATDGRILVRRPLPDADPSIDAHLPQEALDLATPDPKLPWPEPAEIDLSRDDVIEVKYRRRKVVTRAEITRPKPERPPDVETMEKVLDIKECRRIGKVSAWLLYRALLALGAAEDPENADEIPIAIYADDTGSLRLHRDDRQGAAVVMSIIGDDTEEDETP